MKRSAFNLLDERLKYNSSQRDVAEICEVYVSTVSRWENGKTAIPPGYVKLLRLVWKQSRTKS